MEVSLVIEQWLREPSVRFVLQPIVSLSSAQLVGYELLSRPMAGTVELPVESFFQTASEQGAAVALDRYLIGQIATFLDGISVNAPVFINLHPDSLKDAAVQAGVAPLVGKVVIEVTERMEWDFGELASFLRSWQQRGGSFALDDFGSGYSGLEKLVTVRPNYVKLDARLVRGADESRVKQNVIEAVSHLASILSFQLLGEGIETEGELETCVSRGVTLGQGYYFCRPLPWDSRPQVDETAKAHVLKHYHWMQQSETIPRPESGNWAYHAALMADVLETPDSHERMELIAAALHRALSPHSVTVLVATDEGLRPQISLGHAHRSLMLWSTPSLARTAYLNGRMEVRQTSGGQSDRNGLTGDLNRLLGSPESVAICPIGTPPWGLVGADYLPAYAWSEQRLNVLQTYARLMTLATTEPGQDWKDPSASEEGSSG